MMTEQEQQVLYPGATPLTTAPPPDPIALHKKAFRVAYDTLRELWPLESDKSPLDYWRYAAGRMALKYEEHKDNPLCAELLMAVWAYLEKESVGRGRDGKGQTNERSNAADADMDGG